MEKTLGIKSQSKNILMFYLSLFVALTLLLLGKDIFAATVNVASGTFADFYSTFIGFIYGVPGITIGILILLFGVVMMVAKHFFVFIICLLAVILFFLSPEIVLGLAQLGAKLAGAII